MSDEIGVITIRIEGLHPKYDGDHEVDLTHLKTGEIKEIKRLSGLRPLEYGDAFALGDTDWVVGLASVALRKDGIPVVDDVLWNAEVGQIKLVMPDDEDDVDPPTARQPEPQLPEPDESGSSSGSGSSASSDSQETTQPPSGGPASGTGSGSE